MGRIRRDLGLRIHLPRPVDPPPQGAQNISRVLKKGDYLYGSFINSIFAGDRNGRSFTDITEEFLKKILALFNELTTVEMMMNGDVRGGRENEKWLNVLVGKG